MNYIKEKSVKEFQMDQFKLIEIKVRGLKKLNEFDKLVSDSDNIGVCLYKRSFIEKENRKILLKAWLKAYGLILRNDSKLLQHYINTGTFQGSMNSIKDICRTMYHAEYLSKIIKPETKMDTDSLKIRNEDYKGTPEERPLFNSKIETDSIKLFAEKHNITEPDFDIVSAIKYIITNPDTFNLKKCGIMANTDKYPFLDE